MNYAETVGRFVGRKLFSLIAVSTMGVVSLSACADGNVSGTTSSQSPDGVMGSDSALSASDIMFLQMMIPHHEQAIEMSKLAVTNTKNPDVQNLAARIESAQKPEIDLMKKLLSDAGHSVMPDHGMSHNMGDDGMLSESDLSALASAQDRVFDARYLTGMIAHHTGAIAMTGDVADSSNSDVKTLANNIVSSQTAELAEMNKLLVDALAL